MKLARRASDASLAFGLWLFAAGGVQWERQLGRAHLDWELAWWSLFLVPSLLFAWAAPREAAQSWLARLARAVARRLRGAPRWAFAAAVGGAFAVLAGFHLVACLNRYFSFRAGMDLAIYANACRDALHSTVKGDVPLLADHFEPVLLAFTPLCRAGDPALVLITVQVLSWLAGALGVTALARAAGWSRPTAALAGFLYLELSGLFVTISYDFHLIALAAGLLPWMFWALVRRRFAALWPLAIVYLGLKESAALTLVGFAAYVALGHRDPALSRARRYGHALALAAAGVATFLFVMRWLYPHLRPGSQDFYFAKYYSHLGHSLGDFVHTALTRPFYFAGTFLTVDKENYVLALLAPFLFVHLLRPGLLLPALPALFVNVASNDPNLLYLTYHYEAELYPALFLTALLAARDPAVRARWHRVLELVTRPLRGLAARRLPAARRPDPRAALLAGLLVFALAPAPGFAIARWRPEKVHMALEKLIATKIGKDEAVAANQRVAAHLTSRPRLYLFDYWGMEDDWKRADTIVVGYPDTFIGWYRWEELEHREVPRFAADFDLVYKDPFYPLRIWRRRSTLRSPAASAATGR